VANRECSLRLEAALFAGRTAGNLCESLVYPMHYNPVPLKQKTHRPGSLAVGS
jgi:hypothetical protein